MAHGVNMAIILGNLTRDPELRYTPAGHAVCSFGVATNRSWTTAEGEQQDRTEFHNVVAWNKLAEICSQYLVKGQKVYIQGRLQTRTWEGKDGNRRSRTEIVADQMVMLQRPRGAAPGPKPSITEVDGSNLPAGQAGQAGGKVGEVKKGVKEEIKEEAKNEDVDPEEVKKKMPF